MKSLDDKLQMFSRWKEPYVWRLKLSSAEFVCLRDMVIDAFHKKDWQIETMWTPKFARLLMVYVAEWYKRCYNNKQTTPPAFALYHLEYRKMWEASGFDYYKYVYRSDGGFRWQYSTYILGGLAAKLEIEKKDNRLLKNLCLLMHGEDIDMDSLADGSRAFALRQSIEKQHSLYYYLQAILQHDANGYPFADEDIADSTSLMSQLLKKIQTADREAMRDKFRAEWIITFAPHLSSVSRMLKLSLMREYGEYAKPDLSRPYLSYQRLEGTPWNIPSPENHKVIAMSIRWKNGQETVKGEDFDKPIIHFNNTQQASAGYLAFACDDYVLIDVPAKQVTSAEVYMACDGEENHSPIMTIPLEDCIQLWRVAPGSIEWTTTEKRKTDTAVFFSGKWHVDEQLAENVFHKPLTGGNEADLYGFTRIYTDITLNNDNGNKIKFFNHTGHYIIEERTFDNDIAYNINHTVTHYFIEDEGDVDINDLDEGDFQQEQLPVLFGLHNLTVSHLQYDENGNPMEMETVKPKCIENLQNGDYVTSEMPTGKIALRIHIDDELSFDRTYFYVPVPDGKKPLERNLKLHEIKLYDGRSVKDNYKQNYKEQSPCLQVRFGSNTDFISLDVFRPQDIIEVNHNGKIIEYHSREDRIDIPLLLCNHFSIRDFGEEGVKSYDCSEMKAIYTKDFKTVNKAVVNESLFLDRKQMSQTLLNGILPDYLYLYLVKNTHRKDYYGYEWDYKTPPTQKLESEAKKDNFTGVFFEGVNKETDLSIEKPIFKDLSPFAVMSNPNIVDEKIDRLDVFLTASRLNAYYFLFRPLRMIVEKKIYKERLLLPLMQLRQSQLTVEDKDNLRRFAFEFKLDWYKIEGMLQDIKKLLKRI